MDAYPAVIAKENAHYLPFLMTTTIMMEAVKAGVGRETAHKAIKEHAVATVNDLRAGKTTVNDLVARLANDQRIPLDHAALNAIVAEGESNAGAARAQIESFERQVHAIEKRYPAGAAYAPGAIL
jgi:adenylosuccinate lyase